VRDFDLQALLLFRSVTMEAECDWTVRVPDVPVNKEAIRAEQRRALDAVELMVPGPLKICHGCGSLVREKEQHAAPDVEWLMRGPLKICDGCGSLIRVNRNKKRIEYIKPAYLFRTVREGWECPQCERYTVVKEWTERLDGTRL